MAPTRAAFAHGTATHCATPHRTASYHRVRPHGTALHCTTPHHTAQHSIPSHNASPRRTAPHRTLLHRTVPHRTIPYLTTHPTSAPQPTLLLASHEPIAQRWLAAGEPHRLTSPRGALLQDTWRLRWRPFLWLGFSGRPAVHWCSCPAKRSSACGQHCITQTRRRSRRSVLLRTTSSWPLRACQTSRTLTSVAGGPQSICRRSWL